MTREEMAAGIAAWWDHLSRAAQGEAARVCCLLGLPDALIGLPLDEFEPSERLALEGYAALELAPVWAVCHEIEAWKREAGWL